MTSTQQSQTLPRLRCDLCGEPLQDGACPSAVCRLPDPQFSRIHTVSEEAEETWALMRRYKYDDEKHLAGHFGRMLVDYLEENRQELRRYDVVTPSALYIGPGAKRLWDYLKLILDEARLADRGWPFETGVITKVRPTGRFLGIGVEERADIAEGELRDALDVPDPKKVEGKRVLVIDDMYSEGFTLREMARGLREAGAAEVAGLVFARRKGA